MIGNWRPKGGWITLLYSDMPASDAFEAGADAMYEAIVKHLKSKIFCISNGRDMYPKGDMKIEHSYIQFHLKDWQEFIGGQ